MTRLPLLSVVLLSSVFVAPARAQPSGLGEASAEPPHEGLFLRLTPGIAAGAATTDEMDSTLTLKGGAGRLGIGVGWAVSPRIIVGVELLGHAVLGPELERDGDTTQADDEVAWSISYAGAGLNYYLPSNLYLAASAGALMMKLETSTDMAKTDLGFGMKLALGHEWWATPELGLGLGLELLAGSVPDGDASWSLATLGLSFSATYN